MPSIRSCHCRGSTRATPKWASTCTSSTGVTNSRSLETGPRRLNGVDGSMTTAGTIMSSSSRSLPEQRSDALLHLLGGDVFLVRRHPPEMPVRILELPRAVAVELIRDGLEQPGALGHRPLDERVHVFDVEVDADR